MFLACDEPNTVLTFRHFHFASLTFKYLNHDYLLVNILARSILTIRFFHSVESHLCIIKRNIHVCITSSLSSVSIVCICRRILPGFGASAKVIGTWRIVSSGVLNYRSTRAKVHKEAWPVKNIVSRLWRFSVYSATCYFKFTSVFWDTFALYNIFIIHEYKTLESKNNKRKEILIS